MIQQLLYARSRRGRARFGHVSPEGRVQQIRLDKDACLEHSASYRKQNSRLQVFISFLILSITFLCSKSIPLHLTLVAFGSQIIEPAANLFVVVWAKGADFDGLGFGVCFELLLRSVIVVTSGRQGSYLGRPIPMRPRSLHAGFEAFQRNETSPWLALIAFRRIVIFGFGP